MQCRHKDPSRPPRYAFWALKISSPHYEHSSFSSIIIIIVVFFFFSFHSKSISDANF